MFSSSKRTFSSCGKLGISRGHFGQVHRVQTAGGQRLHLRVDQEISVQNFFPVDEVERETKRPVPEFSPIAKHHCTTSRPFQKAL